MGRMVQQFLIHMMPNVVRPLQALWNQMIGFLFLVLAVSPIPSAIKALRHTSNDSDSLFRVVLSFGFAALMAYFGITSLLRARRISRP